MKEIRLFIILRTHPLSLLHGSAFNYGNSYFVLYQKKYSSYVGRKGGAGGEEEGGKGGIAHPPRI